MKTLCFYSLLLLVLSSQAAASYDYFMLSQSWIPTFCMSSTCKDKYLSENQFALDGLWPQKHLKNKSNEAFSLKEVEPIRPLLDRYWYTLVTWGENEGLWQNQWETHGVYARDKFDQISYFALGLDAFLRVDVLKALLEAGIMPSNKLAYKSSSVIEAIKKVTEREPKLTCDNDGRLKKFKLCLDKDAKNFIDCTGGGSCPEFLNIPKSEINVM